MAFVDIESSTCLIKWIENNLTETWNDNLPGIYLLKVNSGNTRKMWEFCSKSTIKTLKRRKMFVYADKILIKVSSTKAKMKRTICPKWSKKHHRWNYTHNFDVIIVDFDDISYVVFLCCLSMSLSDSVKISYILWQVCESNKYIVHFVASVWK